MRGLGIPIASFVLLLSASACSPKANDSNPNTPPKAKVEGPLLDLEVVTSAEQNGTVLMVVSSDGNVIHKSGLLNSAPQIYKSRGLVAYTYRDGLSLRLKTINTLGEDIPTATQILDDRSKIFISDNIIAFTAILYSAGKVDGATVPLIASGRRVFAFNRSGLSLGNAAQLLVGADGQDSKIQVTNKLIAFTALLTQQGKLLSEEGSTKTFESIPVGTRLFTYTDDGRSLNTASVAVDSDTDTRILDSAVIFKNAPQFTVGKLLKEENGSKTYESIPAGRKTLVFKYDGTIAH